MSILYEILTLLSVTKGIILILCVVIPVILLCILLVGAISKVIEDAKGRKIDDGK